MKILYGVQGTGNGHISRANAISDELAKFSGVQVDWILSGREPNGLFQVTGNSRYFRGLTFHSEQGRISYLKTLLNNNIWQLAKDVKNLDLSEYDCLITDYEPILSWATKLRGLRAIGIGHQYAFNYLVPWAGDNVFSRTLLKQFAPVDIGLGMHWHHFDQPILPPICDMPHINWNKPRSPEKVVVYVPFENQSHVIEQLKPLNNYEFTIYSPDLKNEDLGNINTRALSRKGFKQDLSKASAVITNAGFELISECLLMGIKVMAKPLDKQVEQLCNGAALTQLGYATVVSSIDTATCRKFLDYSENVLVTYPSVHRRIARWLAQGRKESPGDLSEELWKNVHIHRGSLFQTDGVETIAKRAS